MFFGCCTIFPLSSFLIRFIELGIGTVVYLSNPADLIYLHFSILSI